MKRGAALSTAGLATVVLAASGLMFAAGCGGAGIDVGGAGDDSPLTGSFRNVEDSPFQPAWRLELSDPAIYRLKPHELASPAYSAELNRVVVSTTSGEYLGVRATNGEVLWRVSPGGGSSARGTFDGPAVLIGSDEGELRSLDAGSGRVNWSYKVQGAVQQAPVLAGDLVVFVDGTNSVYAVNRADGAWRWQYRRDDPPDDFALAGEARPLFADGRVYVGFSDGHFVALDARDGAVSWTRDLSPETLKFQDVDAAAVRALDSVYVASAGAGLYALAPDTGAVKWLYPYSGITSTALALGDVIAGVDRGEVLRVSTSDGRLVWRTRLPGGAPSEAVVSSSYLLVSQSRGALHFLDSANGRPVTQFRPGYGIDAPATVGQDGTAYLLTNGGVLYGFRPGG